MHHHPIPIRVSLRGGVPAAFAWRGRAYHIRATASRTAVEPDFWRVEAAPDGGHSSMYELRYTPHTKTWHLTAVSSHHLS